MAECPASPTPSDAWDLIKDDWSASEMPPTVMLVTQACRLGVMDVVMKAVLEEERLCAKTSEMMRERSYGWVW